MTQVELIRAEIERLMNDCTLDEDYKAAYKFSLYRLMRFLDTLQEQDGLHFLPMVRLVEMIRTDEWCDRGKRYAEKLVSALENEGYSTDARLVRNHIKYMDGEDVPMATMDKQDPEVDLEKAAVNAYESWKGGTMDDFMRDMEALGKIVKPLRNAK